MTVDAQLTQTEAPAQEALAHQISLTPAAATMAKSLRDQEDTADLRLRVEVRPGGCHGLSYKLSFDDQIDDGDAIVDFEGMELVVDPVTAGQLAGATIDFVQTLQKQGFTIDNPNATSSCACGDSYACG